MPSLTYGDHTTPLVGTRLVRVRAAAAKAMGAPTKAAHAPTIWAILPPSADPAATATFAPLQRLHREIWLATDAARPDTDTLTLPELVRVFNRSNDRRAQHKDARKRRQDPVTAAIFACHEVGWVPLNLTTMLINGDRVNLIRTSPAELRRLYLTAWQSRQEQLADAHLANKRTAPLAPGLQNRAGWYLPLRTVYKSLA